MAEVGKEIRPHWSEIQSFKDAKNAEAVDGMRRGATSVRSGVASLDVSNMVDVLDFEQANPGIAGAKQALIRDLFRVSAIRYYQALNRFIDEPAALERNALLVHSLQRLREERRARLASRRFV